jgi:hypothetical protein
MLKAAVGLTLKQLGLEVNMIKYNKPNNLNGTELRQELKDAGVVISDSIYAIELNGDELFLDIKPADEVKAAAVVAAHNGTTVAPEPTIETKLASVGLNLDDLKTALGL